MGVLVEADLELTTPAGVVRIESERQDLVVHVPDGRTGLELLRTLNGTLGGRRSVERMDGMLRNAGLGLRVKLGNAELAHLGAGAQPGLVARLAQMSILR